MKAVVIDGLGRLSVRDVPEPAWPAGEPVIATRLAGICNTDLELAKGYMGFVGTPGHEFVGVVQSGPAHLVGRRVVGEINAACGRCETCRAGLGRHCPHRTVLGIAGRPGVFAERFSLPAENLLPVSEELSDEDAVFTEPLAAAMEILEQISVPRGQSALVLGDGKLGLLVAQVLALHGCHVCLRGHHERKLGLARKWGVTASCVAPGESAAAAPGQAGCHAAEKFPLVVEATGTPAGLRDALSSVQPRGTVVLKSTYAPSQLPTLDAAKVVVDEVTLVGSRCGRFAPALDLLAQRKVDVRCMIDHCLQWAQVEEAFRLAARRGVLKVLVRFDGAG
jgi:threonine dehydrogenase-like Zn-dependent dehydrogenase